MQMLKNAFHIGEIVYHFNLLYSKRKENQVRGWGGGRGGEEIPICLGLALERNFNLARKGE